MSESNYGGPPRFKKGQRVRIRVPGGYDYRGRIVADSWGDPQVTVDKIRRAAADFRVGHTTSVRAAYVHPILTRKELRKQNKRLRTQLTELAAKGERASKGFARSMIERNDKIGGLEGELSGTRAMLDLIERMLNRQHHLAVSPAGTRTVAGRVGQVLDEAKRRAAEVESVKAVNVELASRLTDTLAELDKTRETLTEVEKSRNVVFHVTWNPAFRGNSRQVDATAESGDWE